MTTDTPLTEPHDGCRHCDHLIGCYTDTFHTADTFRCCHCGRERTEKRKPPDMGSSIWKAPLHGPHAPLKPQGWE